MNVLDIKDKLEAFDKAINDAERSPTGDDYNELHRQLMLMIEKHEGTPNEREYWQTMRDRASEQYGSDDVQVYDDARVSESGEGAFVEAWVWVKREPGDDDGESDEEDDEDANND